MKKINIDLLLTNASQVVTIVPSMAQNAPRRGVEMSELNIIENAAVAVKKGMIVWTGSSAEAKRNFSAKKNYDCKGRIVTPGLVDPHTHLIFPATREEEFELRIKGATYLEIAAKGGGIKATVRKLRAAGRNGLKTRAMGHLKAMLMHGTTSIDAKSGYGLDMDNEIKSLRIINELAKEQPVEIAVTFLGAHDVPEEYAGRKEEYVKFLIDKAIPAIAKKRLAEFCDIFCEKGVFEIEDSRRILTAAKQAGFKLKLHAEEFAQIGGAELAAELGAVSADHLMAISDAGIEAMRTASTIAVLLPGTTFFLGLKNYAPARKMIEAGLPVALATDFNPGTSMTESMQIIMTIACTQMKMTPAEALTAATLNAAFAIGRGDKTGSITLGKQADMVVWDIPNYRHIPYHYGVNLVKDVFKKGKPCILK
ncbi:MAG: imidazolonepropionase [Planctomycetes bacterium]|nr:imidazolonepropionase [Planctomycetota bacterium]